MDNFADYVNKRDEETMQEWHGGYGGYGGHGYGDRGYYSGSWLPWADRTWPHGNSLAWAGGLAGGMLGGLPGATLGAAAGLGASKLWKWYRGKKDPDYNIYFKGYEVGNKYGDEKSPRELVPEELTNEQKKVWLSGYKAGEEEFKRRRNQERFKQRYYYYPNQRRQRWFR